LYLWHWPIIVFCRYFLGRNLNALETALALCSSVVVAFVSFGFVESLFRGGDSPITRRQIFSLGLAACILSAAAGFIIYSYEGFPGRYDVRTRQLVLQNTARKSDYQDVCGNWRRDFHTMADISFCEIGFGSSRKIMFGASDYLVAAGARSSPPQWK